MHDEEQRSLSSYCSEELSAALSLLRERHADGMTSDPADKNLFELMVDALVNRTFSLEEIVDMTYEYGFQHGESLKALDDLNRTSQKRKLADNYHYSNGNSHANGNGSSSNGNTRRFVASTSADSLSDMKRASSAPPIIESHQKNGGKDFIGVEPVADPNAPSRTIYRASITVLGRSIVLDSFYDLESAAMAHDRALIRALGPQNCTEVTLNFSLETYAKDSMESFELYDKKIRQALFGTSWTGPKVCDFGFLVVQAKTRKK